MRDVDPIEAPVVMDAVDRLCVPKVVIAKRKMLCVAVADGIQRPTVPNAFDFNGEDLTNIRSRSSIMFVMRLSFVVASTGVHDVCGSERFNLAAGKLNCLLVLPSFCGRHIISER